AQRPEHDRPATAVATCESARHRRRGKRTDRGWARVETGRNCHRPGEAEADAFFPHQAGGHRRCGCCHRHYLCTDAQHVQYPARSAITLAARYEATTTAHLLLRARWLREVDADRQSAAALTCPWTLCSHACVLG